MSYARGVEGFERGMVETLTPCDEEGSAYDAVVASFKSAGTYDVHVRLSRTRNSVESYHCTCPAAEQYLGACKHVVAVLKELQAREQEDDAWTPVRPAPKKKRAASKDLVTNEGGHQLLRLFEEAEPIHVPMAQDPVYLVPRLFSQRLHDGSILCWIEFRIGMEKLYVVRNVADFIGAVKKGEPWALGKSGSIDTANIHWADAISKGLWELIEQAHRDEQSLHTFQDVSRYYYAPYQKTFFDGKRFRLSPRDLERFLTLMGDMAFDLFVNDSEAIRVQAEEGRPAIRVLVRPYKGGGTVRMEAGDMLPLTEDGRLIYQSERLYRVPADFAKVFVPLWKSFARASFVRLGASDLARFFGEVLPRMEQVAELDVAPSFLDTYMLAPLAAELYLDYERDGIAVRPLFSYGETRFNPLLAEAPAAENGRTLIRNERMEKELLARFFAYGFEKKRDQLVQLDEEKSYDFLTECLPAMPDWVEVFYADSFEKRPVRPMPKVTAGVSVNDMDLLEVTFDMKGMDFSELVAILDSYRQKRRYHRMKDKSFITLGDQQLAAIADLVEDAGLKNGTVKGGDTVEMPLANALYLDSLARDDELQLARSKEFRRIVRDIRNPQDADIPVPESLQSILRDYQVTGFNWMTTLAAHRLGGILADDMGLGKTLQVLAFLLAKQEAGAPPSLVVAPTSLLYNWLDEIEKFAPMLTARAVTGTKGEREAIRTDSAPCDLLVTTYNTLKRDIDAYEKQKFRYVFLDEAQHIKNPATQSARAVKRLHMAGCFALTGTPIENTLTELWSIFDFLMPGYLFGHAKFKQRYETPIVRADDKKAMQSLQRHVMPFILRRMKKDVLKELPDKVERKLVGTMTPKQEKIYQAWFLKSKKEIASELAANGFGESRIKILAILTRLRQIACDPALFLEGYEGGSGKLDMLEEVVGEAVGGGHRMLIFSQFTTMLSHIAARLRQMGIAFLYLDGSTQALERIRLVKAFNSGTTPVFLISLKAGGTGLNLTGADMVIHFDPWWNPAVEDQATDRAYRLGQKNNVQVVKLLMKDTVEEKIYKLQEKKKSLIDQMIQPGENFLSKLTEEEIRALFER
mgnify:CR=1 FL=1